jgi:hypothetical protein
MNRIKQYALTALAGAIAGCGPGNGDANVHVTTTDSGAAPNSVVVQHDTVPVPTTPDTVVKEHTIIQQQTDTVVKAVPGNTRTTQPLLTADEKSKIDAWLAAHSDSLNQYGDLKDMMYTGGTPLFNEATGQRIDKYQYIVSQHPDRPWRRE